MTNNILIVYYSHSGNTRKFAELIRQKTGGTLWEIKPSKPYPISYNAVLEQAKKEIRAGYKPVLESEVEQIASYDTIFVGSPNWCSTITPPITAFLSQHDLSGKTVVPFYSHGGGGAGHIEPDIARLCPKSTVLSGFGVYGSGSRNAKAEVSAWLHDITAE